MPNWSLPEFVPEKNGVIELKSASHPILAENVKFHPHDVSINDYNTLVITGPNMGGKSCLLLTIASIIILAQSGCFVPAKSAKLSIFDAIFTRMGMHDDLSRGQSTFWVEMSQASAIVRDATEKSLVIFDELGRGTSTIDGSALAMATVRYLSTIKKCTTLFVTHFPSVATLSKTIPTVRNSHLAFARVGDDVIFLYRLDPGSGPSFGIKVAEMAGIPTNVVENASLYKQQLELQHNADALFSNLSISQYLEINV